MNRLLTTSVVLALSPTCFAQISITTAPTGHDKADAPSYAYYFGGWRDARLQFIETSLRGSGVKLMKKVGYRRDYRSSNQYGRSWSSVTLDLGETSFAGRSTTFSKNYATTPVRVFSASVSWPSTTGNPTTKPAPFTSTYAFPFTKNWPYSGSKDILVDYMFKGGTLANNASWTSTSLKTYYLDAPTNVTSTGAGIYSYGNPTSTACVDSGQTGYAYCYPNIRVYPKKGFNTSTNDKMYFSVYSQRTGKSQQVVQALDFSGSTTGKVYNSISCNKLFVAASPSMLLFFGTASTSGYKNTAFGYIPWNKAYAGAVVWTQAIWDDTVSKKQMLTRAGRATVPSQPKDPLERGLHYQYQTKLMNNYGYFNGEFYMNPLQQWTY